MLNPKHRYLKDSDIEMLFDDFLDAFEGETRVCGNKYLTSTILKNIDPKHYEKLKHIWMEAEDVYYLEELPDGYMMDMWGNIVEEDDDWQRDEAAILDRKRYRDHMEYRRYNA